MNTNRTANYQLSIVVPVYNEEENIGPLVERLQQFRATALKPTCILFVNDGSTDGSGKALEQACTGQEGLFYLSFAKNCGLSWALKAGIDYCQSTWVGYIDADLQTAPEDFNQLLPFAEEYALVTGIRARRKDTAFKRFQSKIGNGFRRMMTHDGATDTGCPLKIMQTAYAKRVPFFTGMHRFLPALIQLQEGGNVKQIPVQHFERKAGKSKFNVWNRTLAGLVDCFGYRWIRSRWRNYTVQQTNL